MTRARIGYVYRSVFDGRPSPKGDRHYKEYEIEMLGVISFNADTGDLVVQSRFFFPSASGSSPAQKASSFATNIFNRPDVGLATCWRLDPALELVALTSIARRERT